MGLRAWGWKEVFRGSFIPTIVLRSRIEIYNTLVWHILEVDTYFDTTWTHGVLSLMGSLSVRVGGADKTVW